MKAVIRKDPVTSWWRWDVTGHGLHAAGERENWEDALAAALDELRWIAAHRQAWPESLLALGWAVVTGVPAGLRPGTALAS